MDTLEAEVAKFKKSLVCDGMLLLFRKKEWLLIRLMVVGRSDE